MRRGKANLATWVFSLVSPCMMGLICTHGYLSIFRAGHRSLVDISRSHKYIFIIYYHSLCMHIDHETLELIRICNLKMHIVKKLVMLTTTSKYMCAYEYDISICMLDFVCMKQFLVFLNTIPH